MNMNMNININININMTEITIPRTTLGRGLPPLSTPRHSDCGRHSTQHAATRIAGTTWSTGTRSWHTIFAGILSGV
jgi:hypothetical protein